MEFTLSQVVLTGVFLICVGLVALYKLWREKKIKDALNGKVIYKVPTVWE